MTTNKELEKRVNDLEEQVKWLASRFYGFSYMPPPGELSKDSVQTWFNKHN